MAKINYQYINKVEQGQKYAPLTGVWEHKLYTYQMLIICLYNKFLDTANSNVTTGGIPSFRDTDRVKERAAEFLYNLYAEFWYRVYNNTAYQKVKNYNESVAKGFWACFKSKMYAYDGEQYLMFTDSDIQVFKEIIFDDTYNRMYKWYQQNSWGIRKLVYNKDGTEPDPTETGGYNQPEPEQDDNNPFLIILIVLVIILAIK